MSRIAVVTGGAGFLGGKGYVSSLSYTYVLEDCDRYAMVLERYGSYHALS